MNDDARSKYRPAPKAETVKCPKCRREMQVIKDGSKNPTLRCTCGNQAKRLKIG